MFTADLSGFTWSGHLLWEGVVPGTSPSPGSDFKVRWEILIGRGETTVGMSLHMVVVIHWCISGLGKPLDGQSKVEKSSCAHTLQC